MTRMTRVIVLAALVLAPALADAQTGSATLSSITCPGTGCYTMPISTTGQVSVQVTGTFNGQLVFEKTTNTVTWEAWTVTSVTAAAVTSTTTTGLWTAATEGSAQYRVRFALYWSGSALVSSNFITSGAGNFAASYVIGQADTSLANAQVLGVLTNGLLKVAITASVSPVGTLATAVAGTDYLTPTGSGTGLSGVGMLASPLSQFAATTSAQVAATVTDETGTDKVVLSTSPTIVAPTIARLANLTTNGFITTTGGNGTLAIAAALPTCLTSETPIYNGTAWVCFTAVNTATSYSNPAWITGLAWGKISSTPTTVAGYGITDIYARGTITASTPFTFSQTWNNAAVIFQAFEINVTNTASSADNASSFLHIKEGVNTVLRLPAYVNGGYGKAVSIGANAITMGAYDNPYEGSIYIGNDISFASGLRFKSRSNLFLFGTLGNTSVYLGEGGAYGGLSWTYATGEICVLSNGACRLTHNTTTGSWTSTLPVVAPKVGGVTSAPAITGNATLVTGSVDVQGKITSTVTAAGTATLTFGTAYTVAPSCFAANEMDGLSAKAVSTTTTVVISGTWVIGDVLKYACIGR